MLKRTSFMVAYDILMEAQEGSKKTNLVYRCNLNFRIIKKWLAKLRSKGLIEFSSSPANTWTTTMKGIRFMLAMERVKAIWDEEIELDSMQSTLF